MKYPFNREEELKDIGTYKSVPVPYSESMSPLRRKFNSPITPKENFQRMCRGEKPLWILNPVYEFNFIQPNVMPDAYARNHGGKDWFGIEWEFETLTQAGMVKPGTRRLSDVTKWAEELDWPDLSAIDWQKDFEENYKDCLDPDRPTMFVIVNGYFERLADLTSFEDTFCYMLEEPEAVEELYNKLDDFHIELMRIAKNVYGADVITFHDDMGSQKNAFVSPATFREMLMPHYKKLNDAAHEMGLVINFHSCGNIGVQIPNIVECGFDFWEGQDNCNDKCDIINKYGDKMGQISIAALPPDLTDEELKTYIKENIVDGIGASGRYCAFLMDGPERSDYSAELLYTLSREKFQDVEV